MPNKYLFQWRKGNTLQCIFLCLIFLVLMFWFWVLVGRGTVLLSSITKARLEPFVKEAFSIAPELQLVESDTPSFSRQDGMSPCLAKEYHISLSRTVPILIHQIDSIVSMLQNKFDCQKGSVIYFSILNEGMNIFLPPFMFLIICLLLV